jgi:hypothetical protein
VFFATTDGNTKRSKRNSRARRSSLSQLYPATLDKEAAEVAKKKEKPFPQAERTRKVLVKKGKSGVQMNARLLNVLVVTLVAPAMAAITNGITFNVRQESGANQSIDLKFHPMCHRQSPTLPRFRRIKRQSPQSDRPGVWKPTVV